MRRRTTFTTRLFVALFLLSAVPALGLLGLATWGLRENAELTGAAAWSRVADTGQDLLDAVESDAPDSVIAAAAAAHRRELSRSVGLARRFELISSRLREQLPWIALALGLFLAAVALWAARSLARGLSRPVDEIVDWAERLAQDEPLPARREGAEAGPREFGVLRRAFRDMADRLAEGRRQALEAERLRTWTEMARRVAHELKNPLTPLTLAVRQARGALESGRASEAAEPLTVIAQESARLDEMARSFAQLGRLPDEPTIEIDVEEMLRTLLDSDLPPAVNRSLEAPAHLPTVRGRLEALSRVFRNLLGNAVDAVGDREDARIDVALRSANGMVEVAIADNGPGIAPEHRDRLWDPDFTTKKRGTGLGLALVRQTVRAHGGDVELADSGPGTRFLVRLPVVEPGESS